MSMSSSTVPPKRLAQQINARLGWVLLFTTCGWLWGLVPMGTPNFISIDGASRAMAASRSPGSQDWSIDRGMRVSDRPQLTFSLDLALEIIDHNQPQVDLLPMIAQSSTDLKSKLPSYADTFLRLEQERQKAKEQAEQFMNPLPNNVCKQKNLPGPVTNICDRFFNESAQIIRSNGLSLQDFNDITNKLRNDSSWKNLFDQELRRRRN